MIDQKCNSGMPLVFAHLVLTNTLGAHKARGIQARIVCHIDLWDRSIYASLLWYALSKVRAREGQFKRRGEEEEDCLAQSFHSTLLSGKLWKVVCWVTDREEGKGGVLSPEMFAQRPGDQLRMSSGINTPTCVYLRGKSHVRDLQGVQGGSGKGIPWLLRGRRHVGSI